MDARTETLIRELTTSLSRACEDRRLQDASCTDDAITELRRLSALVDAAPKWIVNDLGELGVEVSGRLFFCHKGDSLEYDGPVHDDDSPMKYRRIGKREFGETVWPMKWNSAGRCERRYTVEVLLPHPVDGPKPDDDEWRWRDMPIPKGESDAT